MTLILTLEQAPHPQKRTEMRYSGGNLVIGRGSDADWTINDPDMFVSRAHCTISGSDGQYAVTDSSRGGIFVDGADLALGAGKTTDLRDGTRIRMGDFVFLAKIEDEAPAYRPEPVRSEPSPQPAPAPANDDPFGLKSPSPAPKPAARPQQPRPGAGGSTGLEADDFFATSVDRPEPEPAPKNMPEPFESGKASGFFDTASEEKEKSETPFFDDPFTLGKLDTPREVAPDPVPVEEVTEPVSEPVEKAVPLPPAPVETPPKPDPEPVLPPSTQATPTSANTGSNEQRDAFLKGLGLDPTQYGEDDAEAQMEAMGKRYRLLIEGLMHLLRARAQEKQNARLAQTIIGHSDVNPLKFTANTDDAVASTVKEKGHGYLAPDLAINGAFRDLAEHHLNSWNGVQAALRQMIDRFDPAELEEELKDIGRLEALLAGGKRAKLWEAYEERYRQIAQSAEERFLGEVGSDFRDAYENVRGDKQ